MKVNIPTDRPQKLNRLQKVLPFILITLIFLTLTVPLILKPELDIFDAEDERRFHHPTIETFNEQFPNLDLKNYSSATTPLYHLFMAGVAHLFGTAIIPLRLISAMISLGCLLMFYFYLTKRGDRIKAFYFSILFLFSPYFVGPAVRLSTDNAALLFMLLSIYSMDFEYSNIKKNIIANIFIFCTVLIRQLYVWLIGAFLITKLRKYKSKSELKDLFLKILPVIIPVTGIGYFIGLWQGLTPPQFSAEHTAFKLNWNALVYILSLMGIYGVFFGFWLIYLNHSDQVKNYIYTILIGSGIGYLLIHPVSNAYSADRGERGGALWLIASYLPNVLSTSVVFFIFFPIGIVCVYWMGRYLLARQDYLMIVCFVFWLLANLANYKIFQKYYEPFILISIGYVLTTVPTEGKWYYWIGPGILLAGMIGVNILRFIV
ncbi:hypothetical protein HQ585_03870 [candidate division KSB1 bacterium]|nr:hypothetical protein [candidate division KSB1 bacterium]